MQVSGSSAANNLALFGSSRPQKDDAQNDVLAAPQKSEAGQKASDAIKRIKEVGFQQWAEEENDRKLEELREKILKSMGLTEQDLQGMPADRRASIEKMVQDEIQKRLAATSEMNGSQSDDKAGKTALGEATKIFNASNISSRMGLDLLNPKTGLTAQESGNDTNDENDFKSIFRRDEDDKSGLFG